MRSDEGSALGICVQETVWPIANAMPTRRDFLGLGPGHVRLAFLCMRHYIAKARAAPVHKLGAT